MIIGPGEAFHDGNMQVGCNQHVARRMAESSQSQESLLLGSAGFPRTSGPAAKGLGPVFLSASVSGQAPRSGGDMLELVPANAALKARRLNSLLHSVSGCKKLIWSSASSMRNHSSPK